MNILAIIPNDAPIYPLAPCYSNKLIIYMPKSTSKNLPFALELMKKAEVFSELSIGKSTLYGAAFNIDPQSLIIVNSILDFAMYWKGFNVFYNGEVVNNKTGFWTTLQCLITATKCRDYRSHCHIVQQVYVDGGGGLFGFFSKPTIDEYLIPCRQLPFSHYQVSTKHPSSIADQLQALSISYGCDWCPYLDLDNAQKL